jgi:uncharacterized protein
VTRASRGVLLVAMLACAAAGPSGAACPPSAVAAVPGVLATGDSMIQYVDIHLRRRLQGRATVRSDAHIGTGISKPALLDWPGFAKQQMARYAPRVTVIFLGANEGFPMRARSGRRVGCCGKAWSREYARRARSMMDTYARGGAAHVYWLQLPQARAGFFRRAFPAVNRGLRRAVRGRRAKVRLVALNKFFAPRGRYRDSMRYRGRVLRVRQRDGIHLSSAGAAIAARIVARAISRDRTLR